MPGAGFTCQGADWMMLERVGQKSPGRPLDIIGAWHKHPHADTDWMITKVGDSIECCVCVFVCLFCFWLEGGW